jgi:hypothetical protein
MTDYIQVWQCAGCGRIEAPQPCIGICSDRKVLMVALDEHERALAQSGELQERIDALRMLLTRFVGASPRAGGWERSWKLLQEQADQALRHHACRAGET